MEHLEERPETRRECIFSGSAAGVAAVGALWLIWRIASNLDRNHTAEFVGLSLLLGLTGYLAWVLYALRTLRYSAENDRLVLRQAWSQLEVPLNGETHLHRWRQRWTWSGGALRDLGVEAVAMYPPLWVGRSKETWVLQFDGRAVAFRPSPQLLREIKARVRHSGALAG